MKNNRILPHYKQKLLSKKVDIFSYILYNLTVNLLKMKVTLERREKELATGIIVRNNESIDSALKRFRRAVQQDGVLKDARKHEFYEKPSERKKKLKAARKTAK